jgi:cytidine deaminase
MSPKPLLPPDPTGQHELLRLARLARRHAHAPYSRFRVGAALCTREGEIVTGCNIESASYGLTVCAERVAVLKATSEGLRGFSALAVTSDAPRPTVPCGACRQLLWELCGDIWLLMGGRTKTIRVQRLSELLPAPFDRRQLRR